MPNPPNAFAFTKPMDPSDIRDYVLTITQGSDQASFLDVGENIASYTLALTAEAVAAGLSIKSGGGYTTTLTGLSLRFWLEVPTGQTNSIFDGAGVSLGIVFTATTDSTPARVKQKTVVVNVANQ